MTGPRDRRGAFVICSGVALVVTAGVWGHPGSRWLGYVGDPQQASWFLRWTPYAIGHGWNPLVTHHIAYPSGANLMWNTAVVLLGVVLAPITLLLGAVVAYNVALTLAFALSGFAAYLALRRLCGAGWPALAGAVFYELSPYTAAHALGQLNLTAAVAPPLVLLLVHEVVVRRRRAAWRCGVLLGLLAAGQALVSEEMLASTGVATLVVVAVLLVVAWPGWAAVRVLVRRGVVTLSVAVAIFGVLLAVPLAVQFGGPQSLHGPVQRPGFFVTDLANLVVPTQTQLLAPGAAVDYSQRFTGNPVEWAGYLGAPLLVLLGWTVRRRWGDAVVRVAAVCGVAFVVLSLGPSLHVAGVDTGIPLPWRVVGYVPLLADMLPGRMALYVDLCVAVLVSVAVRTLVARDVPRVVRRRRAVLLAAVGVTVLPSIPLPTDTVATPSFFTSAATARLPSDGSVLVVPFSHDFTSVAPMVWQALAGLGFRMPGGYAMIPDSHGVTHLGPAPTPLSRALRDIAAGRGAPALTDPTRAAFAADLHAWDVRAAVVGPMPHRDDALAFLTTLLGCAPQHVGGVDVWWRVSAAGCG